MVLAKNGGQLDKGVYLSQIDLYGFKTRDKKVSCWEKRRGKARDIVSSQRVSGVKVHGFLGQRREGSHSHLPRTSAGSRPTGHRECGEGTIIMTSNTTENKKSQATSRGRKPVIIEWGIEDLFGRASFASGSSIPPRAGPRRRE